MKNKLNKRKAIYGLIIALLWGAEILAGVLLRYKDKLSAVLAASGVAYIIIALIINLFAGIFYRRKMSDGGYAALVGEWISQREASGIGPENAAKSYASRYALLYTHYVLIFIAAFIAGAGFIGMAFHFYPLLLPGLALLVFQFVYCGHFIPYPVPYDILLHPSEFRLLNEAVAEALLAVGERREWRLYLELTGRLTVSRRGNKFIIAIGVNLPRLLAYGELVALLASELALAMMAPARVKSIITKVETWQTGTLARLLTRNLAQVLTDRGGALIFAEGEAAAERAEAFVMASSYAQDYVNAFAKISMHEDLYSLTFGSDNFYQSETPPKNYYEVLFSRFLASFEEYQDVWRKKCQRALGKRFGKEVLSFRVDFTQTAAEEEEARECYRLADDAIHDWVKADWEFDRYYAYLFPLQVVEAFEDGNPGISLYAYGCALYNLHRYDECLEVMDEVLAENPNHKNALYRQALIYANRYDDRCVPLLIRLIARNFAYAGSAMDLLTKYLAYADEDVASLAPEEWQAEKHQELYAFAGLETVANTDIITPYPLPEEVENRLRFALRAVDIESAAFAEIEFNHNRRVFAFVKARDIYYNIDYEEAEEIIRAEGIECDFYPVHPDNRNSNINRAFRRTGIRPIFDDGILDKRRLKAAVRARVTKHTLFPQFVWMFALLLGACMAFMHIGIMTDHGYGRAYALACAILGGVMLLTAFALIPAIIIRESIAATKAARQGRHPRTVVNTGIAFTPENLDLIAKCLYSYGFTDAGECAFTLSFVELNSFVVTGEIVIESVDEKISLVAWLRTTVNNKTTERDLSGYHFYFDKKFLKKIIAAVLETIGAAPEVKI
ncbi:MAG TPA: tetratricopeptide repeat protein [Acholeplasmataceae bacterium]|nr:tetratricopeptide repeat protein [Acholeplasmataceae bacterium]